METLEGLKTINGERVLHLYGADENDPGLACFARDGGEVESASWKEYDVIRNDYPICICHNLNSISFKIQNGPIKENGKNGCQVTDMVAVSNHIYKELNRKYPSPENDITISSIDVALKAQELRTRNRELRGVEGYNKN